MSGNSAGEFPLSGPSSPDWIDSEIDLVAGDLGDVLRIDSDPQADLQLTGLEPILLGWAAKFVIGFAARFAGQAAYDKWKATKKRRDFEALRQQLGLADRPKDVQAALLDPELRHDLVESLVKEGLTVEQAGKIVDRATDRIRDRLV